MRQFDTTPTLAWRAVLGPGAREKCLGGTENHQTLQRASGNQIGLWTQVEKEIGAGHTHALKSQFVPVVFASLDLDTALSTVLELHLNCLATRRYAAVLPKPCAISV